MKFALLSLVVGIVLGYMAQRSRMCFIGGLRDFILVRDTDLLEGAIAFFVTAWLAFSVAGAFGLVGWGPPEYQGSTTPTQEVSRELSQEAKTVGHAAPITDASVGGALQASWPVLALAVVAGLVIGLFSTLANGCPTRQHVLASQGLRDSIFYLIGFYLGVFFYYLITKPLLSFFI
jgi:uncharacterized membrane protein YedE/YeeE